MWLINKSYLLRSEACSESPHCNSITEIRVYKSEVEGYETWYMPIYKSYESAVEDWPYETIVEIKYNG